MSTIDKTGEKALYYTKFVLDFILDKRGLRYGSQNNWYRKLPPKKSGR